MVIILKIECLILIRLSDYAELMIMMYVMIMINASMQGYKVKNVACGVMGYAKSNKWGNRKLYMICVLFVW